MKKVSIISVQTEKKVGEIKEVEVPCPIFNRLQSFVSSSRKDAYYWNSSFVKLSEKGEYWRVVMIQEYRDENLVNEFPRLEVVTWKAHAYIDLHAFDRVEIRVFAKGEYKEEVISMADVARTVIKCNRPYSNTLNLLPIVAKLLYYRAKILENNHHL